MLLFIVFPFILAVLCSAQGFLDMSCLRNAIHSNEPARFFMDGLAIPFECECHFRHVIPFLIEHPEPGPLFLIEIFLIGQALVLELILGAFDSVPGAHLLLPLIGAHGISTGVIGTFR